MATRLGQVPSKRTRIKPKAGAKGDMGSVDDLKAGQAALTELIRKKRLKALKKARRVKARKAAQRRQDAGREGV